MKELHEASELWHYMVDNHDVYLLESEESDLRYQVNSEQEAIIRRLVNTNSEDLKELAALKHRLDQKDKQLERTTAQREEISEKLTAVTSERDSLLPDKARLDFIQKSLSQIYQTQFYPLDCKPHGPVFAALKRHGISIEEVMQSGSPGKNGVPDTLRQKVILRDGLVCVYNGRQLLASEAVIDHVIPKSKKGKDAMDNLVVASPEANSQKSDLDLLEYCKKAKLDHQSILTRINERIAKGYPKAMYSLEEKDKDKEEEKGSAEGGGLLSKIHAVSQASLAGIPADFAEYVHDDWYSRGGKDAGAVSCKFIHFAKKRWNRERPEWDSGKHKGNGNGKKREPESRLI